jgi:hypothetical protein
VRAGNGGLLVGQIAFNRSQNSVEETFPARLPQPLGQLDGLMHGRVRRDGVHEHQLIRAELQQRPQTALDGITVPFRLLLDQRIEGRFPTDNTAGQFGRHAAFVAGKINRRCEGIERNGGMRGNSFVFIDRREGDFAGRRGDELGESRSRVTRFHGRFDLGRSVCVEERVCGDSRNDFRQSFERHSVCRSSKKCG